MNSDLLVTTNREGSNGVSGFGSDWGLTGELLQNLGGSGESITGLSDGDVCEDGEESQVRIGCVLMRYMACEVTH